MKIVDDNRRIVGLTFDNCGDYWAVGFTKIGSKVISKIEPYTENGMHCDLPWFKVFAGDEIIKRVNASLVLSVDYI